MMRQICIHYKDEVPSSIFHAVDVGSAFKGNMRSSLEG